MRYATALLAAAATVCSTHLALAATITFEEKLIDHLDAAGTQTEGEFSYAATHGDSWELITALGNPPSSLATFYNDEDPDVGYTFDIWNTAGELFVFDSVDYLTTSPFGHDQVNITGFRNGIPVGSLALEDPSVVWTTVPANFSAAIDRLQIAIHVDGASAMVLDNFALTPVPEPTCWVLLASGTVGLWAIRRRSLRQQQRCTNRME